MDHDMKLQMNSIFQTLPWFVGKILPCLQYFFTGIIFQFDVLMKNELPAKLVSTLKVKAYVSAKHTYVAQDQGSMCWTSVS